MTRAKFVQPEVWADGHSTKVADVADGGLGCGPSVSHCWRFLRCIFGTADVSELFEKHVY
ncbi:MAG: hypothetical protein ACI31B_01945 [Muribaculaceae bacterium]